MPIVASATYPTRVDEGAGGAETVEAVYSVRVVPAATVSPYYLTSIKIVTDKVEYRPGETMTITFTFYANTKAPMGYGATYWYYINGSLMETGRVRFYDSDQAVLRKQYNIPVDITAETYITVRIVATKALTYG